MPAKHVTPSIALKAFSCPHCGAFADQLWLDIHCQPMRGRETPNDHKANNLNFLLGSQNASRMQTSIALQVGKNFINCNTSLNGGFVARCASCGEISLWVGESIVYPPTRHSVEPNADLNADIQADFNEARQIFGSSPRGAAALLRLCVQKLCKQLGKPGENINADIGALVKGGLPVTIQQALDAVRVIGNDAVHPGVIDLNDDRETAAKLFDLINIIAESQITQPKAVAALYAGLPRSKRDQVAKRDGTA